ncbi:MAG: hypothetical protein EP330_30915 [Deltaproteobacteria bacterium]|nr:MAG: hypothetical protein EP330_30915 [Deltaproteobacteria bacterium]
MHRTLPLIALAAVACWPRWEREFDERWTEMADHEDDALAAVRALAAGDLDAVHTAGKALAREDEVKQLPDEFRPLLAAVRERGANIGEAADAGTAAKELVTLVDNCRSCHVALKVDTVGREATGVEAAWLGLLWQDETEWKKGGLEGEDWSARATALEQALTPAPAEPAEPEAPSVPPEE